MAFCFHVYFPEILSGSTFFVVSIQYQYSIGWSTYLYSFFSFLLIVVAFIMMTIRGLWIFLTFLDTDSESVTSLGTTVSLVRPVSRRQHAFNRQTRQLAVIDLESSTMVNVLCRRKGDDQEMIQSISISCPRHQQESNTNNLYGIKNSRWPPDYPK